MFRLNLLSLCLLLAGVQASPAFQESQPDAIHLVGHEDALLLQRIQDLIDDWDPRKLSNPVFETVISIDANGTETRRKLLKRPDLGQFIADVAAAEALGKAFFWEMQAGSDFRRVENGTAQCRFVGTACASCHYRNGADARNRNTSRIPYVVWDKFVQDPNHPLEFGEKPLPFDPVVSGQTDFDTRPAQPLNNFSLIIGSQGVQPQLFGGFQEQQAGALKWKTEIANPRDLNCFHYRPAWSMFLAVDDTEKITFRGRQLTDRNSPSVVNSIFADRLFHDGRAESTFNGFSIFGDRDQREVIHRAKEIGEGQKPIAIPVHIAITNAATASQAVGPIVNEVEMSYLGRTFPNLAYKLLDAPVLGFQEVAEADSVFGPLDQRFANEQLGGGVQPQNLKHLCGAPGRTAFKYRELIKRAFRKEWWDERVENVDLVLLQQSEQDRRAQGSLMEANFSLFWGLSIMLYEASLVSNDTPFDHMLRGDSRAVEFRWKHANGNGGGEPGPVSAQRIAPVFLDRFPDFNWPEHTTGSAVFQHGFRVFLRQDCIECHAGPLFSEIYDRLPEAQPFPIAYLMERALLPNSAADALAVIKQERRERMLAAIEALLANDVRWQAAARKLSIELDGLREISRGNPNSLRDAISLLLGLALNDADSKLRDAIARLLLDFEKGLPQHFGNRSFFSEDERVAMAELIVGPVLVEKMIVPSTPKSSRPPLPIQGPLARQLYAFYDLGFYNIGVAPPRYDFGIGESQLNELSIQEKVEMAARTMSSSPNAETRNLGKRLLDQAARNQLGDRAAQQAIRENEILKQQVETLDKERSQPFRQAISGGRGSAYQFRAEYSRKIVQEKRAPKGLDQAENARNARKISEGPKVNPDDADRGTDPPADITWDRSGISANQRRSSYYFESRARELVSNEEPWGYRKPFLHDNELAYWGAFKTPSLRNVELTAPYMHNGRLLTLLDVIEFYEHDTEGVLRHIPRDVKSNPDKHPEIGKLNFNPFDKLALYFFLLCLTDERVRLERAPFDHPSLEIVNGYNSAGDADEQLVHIPPSNRSGHPYPGPNLFPTAK